MKKIEGGMIIGALLCMMVLITSCHAQQSTPVANTHPTGQQATLTIGAPVTAPGRHLMVVFQDSRNNYWFGSWGEGLYRYDGKTLLHFTTKDGLCHDRIEQIQEDKAGNLYFNTAGGVSKFDGQHFKTLSVSPSDNGWQLTPDDLWFKGTQNSGAVYRYDGQDLHDLELPKTRLGDDYQAKYPTSQTYSPYDVYSIYKDTKGNIWFGTGALGACRYDGKSFTWISDEDVNELHDGPSNGVRSFIEDHEGKFWFSNTFYRYAIDPQGNYRKEKGIGRLYSLEISGAAGDDYLSVAKDKEDVLWIVTYTAGVWRYDARQPPGKNLTRYVVKEGDKPITLYSIYKDRQGVLWLGTHENGAYKFNGKTFEKFTP